MDRDGPPQNPASSAPAPPRPKPRKKRKPKLTPGQLASQDLDRGLITKFQYDRILNKLRLLACSSTWADAQWDHDTDRNPRKFWGTNKRRCGNGRGKGCGRETPPQDLVRPSYRAKPKKRKGIHQPGQIIGLRKFQPYELCTDCRTKANFKFTTSAQDRGRKAIEDENATLRAGHQIPVRAGDIAVTNFRVEQLPLPPEDDESLRAQIDAYRTNQKPPPEQK